MSNKARRLSESGMGPATAGKQTNRRASSENVAGVINKNVALNEEEEEKKNQRKNSETLSKRDMERMQEMIDNPELVFDQEKYAPDGHLRTCHGMEDPDKRFEEAKKARYIRGRYAEERDKELSISEIFSKE